MYRKSPFRQTVGRPWRATQSTVSRALFARGQLDTSQRIQLVDLGIDSTERGEYAPSGWFFTRRMFRECTITPDDVFVDIGSGQGRMVYMAARRYPFGRVIGVEIAPALNAVARENIERMRPSLRCQNVELVTSDATLWEVPDDLTYAYLYHPFGGEPFQRVLENICASLDRRPRPLKLIYAHPALASEVIATGRFEHVRTSRGLRRDIPMYRIDIFTARV